MHKELVGQGKPPVTHTLQQLWAALFSSQKSVFKPFLINELSSFCAGNFAEACSLHMKKNHCQRLQQEQKVILNTSPLTSHSGPHTLRVLTASRHVRMKVFIAVLAGKKLQLKIYHN